MTGGDRHDARRGRTRPRLGEKSALSEEVREPAPQTAEGVPTGGKTASQEPGSSGKGGCVKMPRDGRGTAPGVARRSALRSRCGVARRMGEQWLKASGNREDETATARQGCMGSCCFRGCSLSSHGAGKRPFAEVGDPGGPASDSRAFQGAPAGEGVGQAWETEELMPREA